MHPLIALCIAALSYWGLFLRRTAEMNDHSFSEMKGERGGVVLLCFGVLVPLWLVAFGVSAYRLGWKNVVRRPIPILSVILVLPGVSWLFTFGVASCVNLIGELCK